MTDTDLLTTKQAAARIGVDTSTIARWVRGDRLPVALRLPGGTGALLFHPADVEALVAGSSDEVKP